MAANLPLSGVAPDQVATIEDLNALIDAQIAEALALTGWQPIDASYGVIYDFSVDGSLSEIVTPDFADGYEYRLILADLSASASANVLAALYLQGSAIYGTGWSVATVAAADEITGSIEFVTPRLQAKAHVARATVSTSAGAVSTPIQALSVTDQRLLRAKIYPSAGTIDGGIVYMHRRACPAFVVV